MANASTAREMEAEGGPPSPVLLPSVQTGVAFRFSGHQTFPLRITWIPKAVGEIVGRPRPAIEHR